jgi:hypothetical protein
MNQRIAAFTASVMGNPEYHKSTQDIKQAKDDRLTGIEHVNEYHGAQHEKQIVKQLRPWVGDGEEHA